MKKKTVSSPTFAARLSRRDFLGSSAAALGSVIATQTFAGRALALAGDTPPHRLVFVFLRGGADALSILAPIRRTTGDNNLRNTYEQLRPTLQIPSGQLLRLANSPDLGLHPSARALKNLYDRNQLNFVMNAGSFFDTTSHFAQEDYIERSGRGARGGFLARALDGIATGPKSENMAGVSVGDRLAKSLLQGRAVVAIDSMNPGAMGKSRQETQAGQNLIHRLKNMFSLSDDSRGGVHASLRNQGKRAEGVIETITDIEPADAARIADPDRYGPYSSFQTAVELLKADPGLRFTTINVPGWDDHVSQGTMGGKFDQRLERLSEALAAFIGDLKRNHLLSNTTVVVMSEFGRRVKENSAKGTDHGRGGLAMILGEGLPQQVVDKGFSLTESKLWDGNLPVLVDYQQIFAEILRRKFRVKNLTEPYVSGSVTVPAVFADLIPKFVKVLG